MSGIPHLGFIVAAYAVTTLVMLAMIIAVVLDGRAQRRLLAKLEARSGVRRAGSAAPGDGSA
ncbi:MAG TPA: heme exporter protein CcmD [Lichenihabitans sp.]|jgi:heme exporter protein D|nr:heme exporter protein CcmD [Lichenihabitans sp.]